MREKTPTVQEYQERRMGSSAVEVCLAITEYEMANAPQMNLNNEIRYCFDMEMPLAIMEKNELKPLCNETNIIISA